MNAQIPAEGILLKKDWGDAKTYEIACDCGGDNHNHSLWVEADEGAITVSIMTTEKTDYWSEAVETKHNIDNDFLQRIHWFFTGFINGFVRRIILTKNIWIDGYAKYETHLMLSKQQALNYSNVLVSAIDDVDNFRKEKK